MFQESQSSAFWFQPGWGPLACAQPEVIILYLGGGPSSCGKTQRLLHISLEEKQGPCSITTLLFLFFNLFTFYFIFGCFGSSLLHMGFL